MTYGVVDYSRVVAAAAKATLVQRKKNCGDGLC
jgi:hypothetical protein